MDRKLSTIELGIALLLGSLSLSILFAIMVVATSYGSINDLPILTLIIFAVFMLVILLMTIFNFMVTLYHKLTKHNNGEQKW